MGLCPGISPGKPNGTPGACTAAQTPAFLAKGWSAPRYCSQGLFLLRRKEVIHPLVLEGIPCFDLTPITGPALDAVPLAVGQTLSGLAGSHGVTGSVYKARERIHRGSADPRLLAIPASRSRIADSDPYWGRLSAIRFASRRRNALYRPL